jgi:hypothetical protein
MFALRPALATLALVACSSNNVTPIGPVAAAPPRDDGKSAQGGAGGVEHAAALEQLKAAPLTPASDRQGAIRIALPDAEHWMRVKFWGIPTLVGFRYGQGHHAVIGGYVTHVPDNAAPGACAKSFEEWAVPLIDAYDIDIQRDSPRTVSWKRKVTDESATSADIESLVAKGATLMEREQYAAAYATYPAWKGACLILGVAVPVRDGDMARAMAVRDRFATEVLPAVQILSDNEPLQRF